MDEDLTRKEFLQLAAGTVIAAGLGSMTSIAPALAAPRRPLVAMARNQSPAELVRATVNALGGMKRFVKPGNVVVVKPNAAWARTPAQAANTNPEVVAEIVRLCKQAGARLVKVMDHAIDQPAEMTFDTNGIRKAATKAGGIVIAAQSRSMYQSIRIPRGKVLRSSDIIRDVLQADVFINVPIAKVHGSVPLTLGMKNLMGVTFDRGSWHNCPDLNQAIADYSTVVKPDLIIMDAVRVLLTNGPKGPGQTKDMKMVLASTDPVAIDSVTAKTIFNMAPTSLQYLVMGKAAGTGENDLKRITVKKV